MEKNPTYQVTSGSTAPGDSQIEDKKRVKIFCKAYIKDGVMHFEMSDSNGPTKVVAKFMKDDKTKIVVNHTTIVKPGINVFWEWKDDSVIQEFVKIGPQIPGKIITGNAEKVQGTKIFKLKIPSEASKGKEEYDIEFKYKDGIYPIDPYLKIPDQ